MFEFLKEQILKNQFFSAAIGATLLASLIVLFKKVPNDVYKFVRRKVVFQATIFEHDILYDDFESWFFSNYSKKYKEVEATGIEQKNRSMPESYDYHSVDLGVYFKQLEGRFFIKYDRKCVYIEKGRTKLEQAKDTRELFFNQYHLTCIDGAETIKKLLQECRQFSSIKRKPNEIKIYTHNSYEWYVVSRINAKKIENVILNKKIKTDILNDLQEFIDTADWYKEASIFYKRTYIFYGEPGNGKSSLSIAIGSHLNKDIYCLDLNSITDNNHLRALFSNLNKHSMLLIEDFDGFFNLREPVKKDNKISFSTLLNCIDGAFYKEGLITIITTNKLDTIDPALKRKGRADMIVEVKQPRHEEVTSYLKVFYRKDDIEINNYNRWLSMCDIQEICLKHKDSPEDAISELLCNN